MLFKSIILCFAFFIITKGNAQKITGIQVSVENKDLVINYRAADIINGSKYLVRLYSSLDNFSQPLTTNVIGDVGEELTLLATNKIIIKDPLTTLGNLEKPIEFKVEATLVYAPVFITSPKDAFKHKRGSDVQLKWKGGLQGDQVTFDLLKDNIVIQKEFYTLPVNTGKAKVPMGKKLKLGDGYQVQMQVSSLNENYVFPEIRLKRKFSIFSRVFWTIAALGAADYYLNPNSVIRYEILGFRDPLPEAPSVPSN